MEPPFKNTSTPEDGVANSAKWRADVEFEQGLTLHQQGQYASAQQHYQRTLTLYPRHFDALHMLGVLAYQARHFLQALNLIDRALETNPNAAVAYYNRGTVLKDINRLEEALTSYDQAIKLKPDFTEAYNNRGVTLQMLNRLDEALASYHHALTINPNHDFLYGQWLNTKMRLCDWSNIKKQTEELIQKIERGEKVSQSFSLIGMTDSLVLQRKAAEMWVRHKFPTEHQRLLIHKYKRHKKIRIGYFSMDFKIHPISYLTAELFEIHDREKFEIYAFSLGQDTKDEMRKKLEVVFDKFIDVNTISDEEVVKLARSMEIDIAIDLAGHTADARTSLFALRVAPLQINYLGHPATMGAEYIDYLIADKTIIPEESKPHYSEKIIYLPVFQVNDRKRKIADTLYTREELGLPSSGFVFCCFNSSYKINPPVFDGWMRILKQVEGSVLWLLKDNVTAANNLLNEAEARGVNANRLIFTHRLPMPEYLARYRCADLFLDTLPFNAGATASDALWSGLPILSCEGDAFASRMSASLLQAIGLSELITTTQAQYESLAIELATHPTRLNDIKQKLARNRLTTPLFDTPLFTKHLENAYAQIYERYQADLPPEHIYIMP